MFYISQFRKYIQDPDHAIVSGPIEVNRDLVDEEHPV